MIVKAPFEGVIDGEIKKFAVGDTITKAEAEELNAEAKGFIKAEKPTKAKTASEGE